MNLGAFIKILRKQRKELTPQQFRTIRGQALAGDIEGAEKGLNKLMKGRGRNADRED